MNPVKRNGAPSSDDSIAHGESLTLELNSLVNIVGVNTGPWPLRHVTPNAHSFPAFAGHTHQQPQLHYPSAQSFSGWRSAGVPSDPGTNGVDSGYGEPWHGFGWDETSSFQGAECPADTLHTGELLSGLEIGPADAMTGSTISPQVGSELQFYCKGCNTFLRKKSELNKHAQRHNKPHRCDYVGCSKSKEGEGFSTTNDLIRHKKSVHGEHDKGPVYSCPYGSCAEKPDKVWPRADNFRSHLSRSHQRSVTADSDLSIYVKKSIPKEASGGATQSRASLKGLQMLPEQLLIEKPTGDSDTETACVKGEDRILADITLTPAFDESIERLSDGVLDSSQSHECSSSFAQRTDCTQVPAAAAHEQTPGHDGIFDHKAKLGQDPDDLSALHATTFTSSTRRINFFPETQAVSTSVSDDATPQMSTFNELKEGGMKAAQIVAFLKTFPKSLLKNALENDADTSDRESTISAYSHQRNDHKCKQCGKIFARPSELKKHQKRHDRPYRCTFRGCTKRFGSKNDWKRHEKKQHEPIDAWVCNIFGCSGVFSTAVLLQRHAQQDHDANHFENMQSFLDDCHVGKSENNRFWCGYCSDVIGLENGLRDNHSLNLWVARCDHIDGHVSGKDGLEQKQFNQWVYLEDKISIDRYLSAPWDMGEENQISRKRKGKSPFNDRPAKRRDDYEATDS